MDSLIVKMTILTLLSLTISPVYSQSCDGSTWKVSYSGDKCSYSGGLYKMQCPTKYDPSECGMRLDSVPRLGQGTYSASIKAAPGSGMNTAFYLYSYGRNNDKSRAWNEIDIEILGHQISDGKTKVWTNVWTGFYVQHYELVTLDWDASEGYHTYAIKIDSTKIYWIFDGETKREFIYTGYSGLVQTIKYLDFQGEMALWGQNKIGWTEMGSMLNNGNSYPLYAYFKSVKLDKCTSCKPISRLVSSGSRLITNDAEDDIIFKPKSSPRDIGLGNDAF